MVVLSMPMIAAVFACSTLFAFSAGRYFRLNGIIRLETPAKQQRKVPVLPDPPVLEGKEVPFTRYTSQLFANRGAEVRSSNALLNHDGTAEYTTDEEGNMKIDINLTKLSGPPPMETEQPSVEDLHGVYQPAGQHLLVDIKNVDSAFLDSEERLATAMIDVITQSELTLLSYHCHGLEPEGVSCVGVLLESHVSFHTWPKVSFQHNHVYLPWTL